MFKCPVLLVCAKEFSKELSTSFGTKLIRAKYRACNGAEPDCGADSGQEPLQIPETECEASDQQYSDHWEPPETGQLGEGECEVGGEEPQATQQTAILPRPPAGAGVLTLRRGMLCCQ